MGTVINSIYTFSHHPAYLFADIDDCTADSCYNGGICHDGIASFTCECAEGFEGKLCEIGKSHF